MNNLHIHFKRVLGYDFADKELLATALTHRSFSKSNNERLEYLGDALLGMFIAEELFIRFPQAAESDLTRLRASLVKKETLAQLAKRLELGSYIRFGIGEHKSGGGQKGSLLGNAVEALIGAVYLDSNFENCRDIVLKLYSSLLDALTIDNIPKDPKSRLQEYLQANKKSLPAYNVIAEEGEAHNKLFTIECCIEGIAEPVMAKGRSKRNAEQTAARTALELMGLESGIEDADVS